MAARVSTSPSGVATKSTPITPNDSTEITPPLRGIHVGGAGDITGRLIDDTEDREFKGLVAGQWYPYAFKLIKATGTTATDLVGFQE